ncbi:MAG: Asp-tRNA(Asn)/Glu-tRNA(Gln) amidotransferase subunit GatC [Deltaproteobacteria bacterium]|nr:Asp-tRNA(Asn)/Glu-tRNA(Gln) amidotransferase subunit GatC [Deltaproteobacteria bacterium]
MSKPASIDEAEVRKVAALARLELDDAEVATMATELSSILGYVASLDTLVVSSVEPTAHAVASVSPLRDDIAEEGLRRDEALAAAPQTFGGAFVVPKVKEGS